MIHPGDPFIVHWSVDCGNDGECFPNTGSCAYPFQVNLIGPNRSIVGVPYAPYNGYCPPGDSTQGGAEFRMYDVGTYSMLAYANGQQFGPTGHFSISYNNSYPTSTSTSSRASTSLSTSASSSTSSNQGASSTSLSGGVVAAIVIGTLSGLAVIAIVIAKKISRQNVAVYSFNSGQPNSDDQANRDKEMQPTQSLGNVIIEPISSMPIQSTQTAPEKNPVVTKKIDDEINQVCKIIIYIAYPY